MGEIAAFTALGLTVILADFDDLGAWQDGTVMAVCALVVVRPAVMMVMLQAVRIRTGERVFLSLTGLKGAVPILLGSFVLTGHATAGRAVYAIVFVVVAASILVQGSMIPWLARRCGVNLHSAPLQPWPLGVRFRSPPNGVRRYRVCSGAPADRTRIDDLDVPDAVWIALVIRRGALLALRSDTCLRAGDEVVLVTDPDADLPEDDVERIFGGR
ncbi:cation:proton antiporter [Streptomyces sp. NPDC057257]|uniref:cation:proton antiporter domain-containing protein n=1 Tax=Streptomyces sp. NPDC057257 TaxID=3346071 RepID=UPI00362AAE38